MTTEVHETGGEATMAIGEVDIIAVLPARQHIVDDDTHMGRL